MLRIRSTDGRTGTTQPWRIISPVGPGAWKDGSLWLEGSGGTERTGGHSLPYHLDINLLDGGGSADIMEHHRPSKVSIRNAAEVADRSLPYSL